MSLRFLIDTHCHLTFPPLCENLPAVLDRASQAAVNTVVVPAYDPPSWDEVARLAADHPKTIYPSLGLHPWVADQPLDLVALDRMLRESGAVAVGEIGLDGKVESPSLEVQIPVLQQQLELARDLDLPVILHCRGAFEELLTMLERFTPRLPGVLHAFTRSPDLARRFMKMGLHLGIGGAVTRDRARQTRATVEAVPLERLLLETDAPSIGLEGVEPIAAEPHHVRNVALAVADLRGITLEAVMTATTENARRLFRF